MKDRSWGCSVTRTCLKNTVTDPVGVQERSPNAKQAYSKRTFRQAEAMPSPIIDLAVANKEGVDALNTLILRKLAKESFMSTEGVSRKVGYSGESHCDKKASSRETLREARSTTISCKCGSHAGKEILSSFPNLHNNTMYTDITKNNLSSIDGGKIPEGVSSLLSRIGLDNRRRSEQELPVFQNSSRFDKVPQPRTFVSTQDLLISIPANDADERQGVGTLSSSREFLSTIGQANNSNASMHTVGHMWCIPETNSVGDIKCTDSSPSHRCSATSHEEAKASWSNSPCPLFTNDSLASFENNFLRPHVNSPVHNEAVQEVISQSSLHDALTKGIQFRIDEALNLQKSRSNQQIDSTLVGRDLIRKIFRDEGEEEAVLLKTEWTEQLKTADHVHWNLRELMLREEIEDDVDANLKAMRTAYLPEQGCEELDCLQELARSLQVGKQRDTKQEDGIGGRGTPRRLEMGNAKVKHGDGQLDGVSREKKRTEPNATPRSQLIEMRTIQRLQVQKERTARKALLRQNHVESSCTGDNCRNVDANEGDDKVFQGKTSSPDPRSLVKSNHFHDDTAGVRELEVDWGTGGDDLEALLKFLTMKQQLRENRRNDVEVVVQTEAIVRELLSRMKLDSDCSPSVDPDALTRFHPSPHRKSHGGDQVGDDGYGEVGKECRGQSKSAMSPVGRSGTIVRDMLTELSFEGRIDSQLVSVHKNQNTNCQNKPVKRRPPFVLPSSSKSQCSHRMTGSTSTRKWTSCDKNFCDQSEGYAGFASTGLSMDLEETRKRSRLSGVRGRQADSRRTIHSIKTNTNSPADEDVIDFDSEEIVRVGSPSYVVQRETLALSKMETVGKANGETRTLASTENSGVTVSNETCSWTSPQSKVAHGSPSANTMPLRSSKNSESRSSASNSPAMLPWNYQREKQLSTGRNAQLASPNKRSTPKSPASSPLYHRQCRDSPTTKCSPNNRPSPQCSPQRQQKPRPPTATLKSTAAQLGALTPTKAISKELVYYTSATLSSKSSQDADNIFPAGISDTVLQESIALAKDSSDPYADFRDSMLEMMQEKNLWQRQDELEDLLQCFLHLNQPVHHQLIHQAFSDVVSCGSPVNSHHQHSKKKRSKVPPKHRSSPSRPQLHEVSYKKSPERGGG